MCAWLQEKEIFIIMKALDGFSYFVRSFRNGKKDVSSVYMLRVLAEYKGILLMPACFPLEYLKSKGSQRDSTIKNINVPCRFSSSFISGEHTASGFELFSLLRS